MEEFVYRKANLNDLEGIYKLGDTIMDFSLSEEPIEFWNQKIIKDCIENPASGAIICAEHSGELAGFAIIQYNLTFKTANIDIMFVVPKYRKSGVGQKIYELAIDNATQHSITKITALTEFDNTSIINFFEKRGFDKTLNQVKLIKEL